MLNSVQHEVLNAHKYKIIKKTFSFFSDSDKPRMLFFLLISVKMPTIISVVVILFAENCKEPFALQKKKTHNFGARN